ncbi:hypothetical protein C8R43DRAFT_189507 [Mycena crocata]|nr:hypothetical protein C8R43DRAFT_189507 [Mycena crocata]
MQTTLFSVSGTPLQLPNGPTDPDATRPAKRKRVRQKASCLACQRRKARCDQIEGDRCEGCIKRKEECVWEAPVLVGNVPDGVAATIGHLTRRVAMLERQMALKQDRLQVNTQEGSASHLESPEYSVNTPNTDTEDAAQALENIALGRRQYHSLGLNSEVPGSHALNSSLVTPGAFTSIFLGTPAPRRSVLQGTQTENDTFLKSLPDKSVSDALVHIFLSDISWIYQILHGPTFLDECRQLWTAVEKGPDNVIDPAWFACYFMVLAWAASSLNAMNMPPALDHYPASDVASLPKIWYRTAELALHASSWAAKPQLRAVQAMLLKISYERPGSQSSGDDADEGTSFFVWLAAATRICQLLGLHRLGSDPSTMPPDDPALPARPCLLKRELAKRIFFFCLVHDWIFVTASPGMSQIHINSFDTDPPLNLDEDDLGLSMSIPVHPPNYMSVYSYTKNLFILAQFQRVATDLGQQRAPVGYATILQLDAGLQKEIHRLEHICDFSNPLLRTYHRPLLLAVLHNRVVRLHRSFFMRGMNPKTSEDKQYQESVTASLRSAEAVCHMLLELGENGHRKFLWWVPAYGLGSCIVLFVRALQKEEQGSEAAKERSLIRNVRQFYDLGTSPDRCSPKASAICKQACRILDGFLEQPTYSTDSPAADIFRQITTKLMTPAPPPPLEDCHKLDGFPDFPSFSSLNSPVGMQLEPFDAEGVHSALLSLTSMDNPLMASEHPMTTDWNQLLMSMDTSTYWGATG